MGETSHQVLQRRPRRAAAVVEPVADRCRRQHLLDERPATGATVQQRGRDRTEAEAVGGSGRDHDPVERRQQLRPARDIDAVAEDDVLPGTRARDRARSDRAMAGSLPRSGTAARARRNATPRRRAPRARTR